ncbi:hypothetical protein YC2023_078189 [Brassica napus]
MSVSLKVFGPTFSLFACLNVRKQYIYKAVVYNSPPPPDSSPRSHASFEVKPFSGLSIWLSSIGHRKIPSPHNSLNGKNRDVTDGGDPVVEQQDSTDPEVEEEYQIQLIGFRVRILKLVRSKL